MARQKSPFVQSFGTSFEIFKSLSDAVLEHGGSDDDLRRIISDNQIRRQLAELLVGNGKRSDSLYPITLDYSQTLEQMIAAGRYDWKNGDINAKNFPVKGTGTVEVVTELIHFNRVMSDEAVLAELNRLGFRPATLEELLAFGAKYPDKQREFPIVALGSVWRRRFGYRSVACLYLYGLERRLGLFWFGGGWDEGCRFLVVRKSA